MFDVGDEAVGFDFAVAGEVAANDGGHQNGRGAGGAGFFEILEEIGAEGGGGVGLAVGAFAGTVVMTELDEDVFRGPINGWFPGAFVAETLRTAAVAGEIADLGFPGEGGAEAGAPAAPFGNGGIPDEGDGRLGGTDHGGQQEEAHGAIVAWALE